MAPLDGRIKVIIEGYTFLDKKGNLTKKKRRYKKVLWIKDSK